MTWSAVKNAKTYSVCLVTSQTATNCYRTTAKSTARTVTFTGLKPTGGEDYFFKVYAWNGSVHSTSSLVGFDLLPVIKPAAVTAIKQAVTSNKSDSFDHRRHHEFTDVAVAEGRTCHQI